MIQSILPSPLKHKRYMAQIKTEDGKEKTIHFGYKSGSKFGLTWIDGATDAIRSAYWARHRGNAVEKRLIDNLVLSPATLSAYILWGQYRNVDSNRKALNNLLTAKKQ